MIKVVVKIKPKSLYELDEIAFNGLASDGHRQDFEFCLEKAIDEFIKKYEKK